MGDDSGFDIKYGFSNLSRTELNCSCLQTVEPELSELDTRVGWETLLLIVFELADGLGWQS